MSATMPAIFFGHGNPMNALQSNAYSRSWAAIGKSVPPPRAVLAVSAHWYVPGVAVTGMANPPTIHDFGGFPKELYEVRYPARGDPDLARAVQKLLAPVAVTLDGGWGLDHGAWSVLVHAFPKADVPVIQMSIDKTQSPAFHFELSKKLSPLRDDGVLIMGSGNVVHNLHAYAWGKPGAQPHDWAARFEQRVRELALAGEDAALVDYEDLGQDAALSIPTPEHYLPLLYVLALRRTGEPISFPTQGIEGGSLSMLSLRVG